MQVWQKLALILLFVSMGLGCASTHKTTTTETTVTSPNKGVLYQRDQTNNVVTEKTETTTTTTTETKTEHPGVISSTFHAIGYVIALPFIIIGGLFRIMFGG